MGEVDDVIVQLLEFEETGRRTVHVKHHDRRSLVVEIAARSSSLMRRRSAQCQRFPTRR